MKEIYDRYLVTKNGDIYSMYSRFGKRKQKLKMTPQLRKDGYYQVCLMAGKTMKSFLVHRLVAEQFLPNKFNLKEVNHKDGDKSNNNVDNLEWTDRSSNLKHRYRVLGYSPQGRALPRSKVLCSETGVVYQSIKDASIFAGRSSSNIIQAINTGCRSGGYHWERVE